MWHSACPRMDGRLRERPGKYADPYWVAESGPGSFDVQTAVTILLRYGLIY